MIGLKISRIKAPKLPAVGLQTSACGYYYYNTCDKLEYKA